MVGQRCLGEGEVIREGLLKEAVMELRPEDKRDLGRLFQKEGTVGATGSTGRSPMVVSGVCSASLNCSVMVSCWCYVFSIFPDCFED